jgi:tetratricopeptide (TPR) repeat protein
MGVMFDNSQQYEKAQTCYEKAIAFNNQEPVYHENLRDAFTKMNKREELEPVLTRMHECFPGNAAYTFQLGQFYDEHQQTDKALALYREALNNDPSNATYFESIGLIHQKLGETDEAEKSFLKSHELQENYLTCNRLGIFYYQEEDYEKAITYYQKAISLNETDAVLWGNLGLAYEKQGNVVEAEKSYLESINLNPDDGGALNRLGLFYYNQQQYDKAISWYKQALEKQPNHAVYLENLALAYDFENQWTESLPIYEQLVEQADDYYLTWRLGVVYYKTGNIKKALDCFTKIREQYSDDLVYLEYVGSAYELIQDSNKALEVYTDALKISPEDEYFNNRAGIQYFDRGDIESLQKALDHYQKAINANPESAVYYYNQALAFAALENNFEKAQQAYQKAIGLDPENDLYHNQYGVLFYHHKRYKEALQEFKKATELNSSVAIYFDNMGLAYQGLNDLSNSTVAFEKAKLVEGSEGLKNGL